MPLAGAVCANCRAPLTPGAKFCHRCGVPAGAPVAAAASAQSAASGGETKGLGGALPWAVAAIALVALIALVAGQRIGARGAASQGGELPPGGAAMAPGAGPRASTDIASMSPEERADRLFNRVMSYAERGAQDSAQLFAPMAVQSYEMLGDLNLDQRYDLGRIGVVIGDAALATAQSDTILAKNPTHLLGLILGAEAAGMRKDAAKARELKQRLLKAEPTERGKALPEYTAHANDIDAALADAKKS